MKGPPNGGAVPSSYGKPKFVSGTAAPKVRKTLSQSPARFQKKRYGPCPCRNLHVVTHVSQH